MKRLLVVLLVLILAAAAFVLTTAQSPFAIDPLEFRPGDVIEVGLTLATADPEKEQWDLSTRAPATIRSLVGSLQTGYWYGFRHRCMWFGTLRFTLVGGRTELIDIRPGHDYHWYEIRVVDTLYRIEREPFLDAIQSLGVPRQRLIVFPDLEEE